MAQFWSTLLYILLFIVFLSALIMVHEAGHLIAAKIFKVYCFEYSIGFGPKLFSKKRKKGETKFSLRAIPFGGFVSMYGEGVDVPDGLEIPPERSLANIKRWKRIIVLFAGVFMNAILALVIFFCSNIGFPQTAIYGREYVLTKDTPIYESFKNAGNINEVKDSSGNVTKIIGLVTFVEDDTLVGTYPSDNKYSLLANDGKLTYKTSSGKTGCDFLVFLRTTSLTSLNVDEQFHYIPYTTDVAGKKNFDFSKEIKADIDIESLTYTLEYAKKDEATKYMPVVINEIKREESSGTTKLSFASLNITFNTEKYHLGFGKAVAQTFADFGESSIAIVKGFAALFQNPGDVSGIIGIGVVSTQVLQNNGWGNYLYLWGLISVNLAIINLLPFPGLDGWHILVNIIEGITHKEIPAKAKNIVSAIGLICLFVLMGALVVADIFKYLV